MDWDKRDRERICLGRDSRVKTNTLG